MQYAFEYTLLVSYDRHCSSTTGTGTIPVRYYCRQYLYSSARGGGAAHRSSSVPPRMHRSSSYSGTQARPVARGAQQQWHAAAAKTAFRLWMPLSDEEKDLTRAEYFAAHAAKSPHFAAHAVLHDADLVEWFQVYLCPASALG